jgi:hypothetical protein
MGAAVSVMPLKVIPFRLFVEFMGASPGKWIRWAVGARYRAVTRTNCSLDGGMGGV